MLTIAFAWLALKARLHLLLRRTPEPGVQHRGADIDWSPSGEFAILDAPVWDEQAHVAARLDRIEESLADELDDLIKTAVRKLVAR